MNFIGSWQIPRYTDKSIEYHKCTGKNALDLTIFIHTYEVNSNEYLPMLYGERGVSGEDYEVIEHAPPEDIKEISATKIRKQLRDEGKL